MRVGTLIGSVGFRVVFVNEENAVDKESPTWQNVKNIAAKWWLAASPCKQHRCVKESRL
jgi:hypothetical protein